MDKEIQLKLRIRTKNSVYEVVKERDGGYTLRRVDPPEEDKEYKGDLLQFDKFGQLWLYNKGEWVLKTSAVSEINSLSS